MITQAHAVACGGPRTIDCDFYSSDSGGDFNFFGVLVVIIIVAILYSRS